MSAQEILNELKGLGSESYKRVIFKHGVSEPCYGVKIGDMQKIVKRIKKDYQLALDLYATGVYDAMYLAGLIADDMRMTKKDLKRWLKGAYCRPLAGWTVAWVASGSPDGWELALEWVDSKTSLTAVAGWATLSSIVSVKPDSELDLGVLRKLIQRVQEKIHQENDEIRYQMNSFMIAVGSYVEPLKDTVLQAADKIGIVTADLGDNDCKTPSIAEYIAKVEKRGAIGKKRKTAKC
jgi:hypothetical protein